MKKGISYFIVTLMFVVSFTYGQNNNLCQGNYYTEEEGAKALEETKKRITTKQDWEKYTEIIRSGILKGTELETFPRLSIQCFFIIFLKAAGSITLGTTSPHSVLALSMRSSGVSKRVKSSKLQNVAVRTSTAMALSTCMTTE